MKDKKRAFTLLELFICVAILAIVSGLLAFPLKGLLDRHRFVQSLKHVTIQLKELQALALNYQRDMGMEISEKKGIYTCTAYSDEPDLRFQPFELKNISSLTFAGKKAMMPLKFKIFASGRIEPQGKLIFHAKDEAMALDLQKGLQITLKEEKHETD